MKHYTHIQLLLCLITTTLMFYFTVPYFLRDGSHYARTDRLGKMANKARQEQPVQFMGESPIKVAGSPEGSPLPPVVKIVKTWDDHLATLAHTMEAASPLSSIAISIYLWVRRRKEKPE